MKNLIEEDMSRQECVLKSFGLIKDHFMKFHDRLPEDLELHWIISSLIDRFEKEYSKYEDEKSSK
jgi:hypothetical protein